MATIFESRPGQVVALDNPDGDLGLPLTVDTVQGSWFPSFQAILTELSLALDGNFQFTHTCKDVIYAYVFGSRISQMRISGLAFSDSCNGGATGVEKTLEFFNQNQIARRQTPIQVQIGTTASGRFRGYLTNMRTDIVKAEARVNAFSFIFHVFPGGA